MPPTKPLTVASAPACRFMVAVCGRSSGLPGSSYPRSANPHIATTPFDSQRSGVALLTDTRKFYL
ncbi:ash family protein [Pseudomonas azerbaijanorientalis]|nr:ash family protein [Pseudomonas azerbaijanorientalis]